MVLDLIPTEVNMVVPVGQLHDFLEFHKVFRTVHYTQLDGNGHMNNTRYLDWVADLLPSKFYGAHQPKELVICYNQEALEGQEIHLQWELNGNGELTVDGHRVGQNEERVFSAQVTF